MKFSDARRTVDDASGASSRFRFRPETLALTEGESAEIARLVAAVADDFATAEDPDFLASARVLAHDLPLRVKRFLDARRLDDRCGVFAITGHPIGDGVGPTPAHWRDIPEPSPTLAFDLLLVLYGSLLGDVFGWATQQDGRIVNDVLPVRGQEREQLGTNSEIELTWHTEDAFHPYRADYIVLACLRNPGHVPTTIGHVDAVALEGELWDALFRPDFFIRPDQSHQPHNNATAAADPARFDRIRRVEEAPDPVAVLSGPRSTPDLRIDPDFMGPLLEDGEAADALEQMKRALSRSLVDVVLEPGDVCFIDNQRVVHGRRPFTARYDGSDRWLKRINVARDLRRAREAIAETASRLIV